MVVYHLHEHRQQSYIPAIFLQSFTDINTHSLLATDHLHKHRRQSYIRALFLGSVSIDSAPWKADKWTDKVREIIYGLGTIL